MTTGDTVPRPSCGRSGCLGRPHRRTPCSATTAPRRSATVANARPSPPRSGRRRGAPAAGAPVRPPSTPETGPLADEPGAEHVVEAAAGRGDVGDRVGFIDGQAQTAGGPPEWAECAARYGSCEAFRACRPWGPGCRCRAGRGSARRSPGRSPPRTRWGCRSRCRRRRRWPHRLRLAQQRAHPQRAGMPVVARLRSNQDNVSQEVDDVLDDQRTSRSWMSRSRSQDA